MNIQCDLSKPSFLTYFLSIFFKQTKIEYVNQIKSSIQHKKCNDRNQDYKHLITRPKQTKKETNIDYKLRDKNEIHN